MDLNFILIIVIGVFTFLNLIILFVNNSRVKKYTRMYEKALEKFNSHENVNDEFQSIYDRLNEIESITNDSVDNVNNFKEKIKNDVQKLGLVKYNAYDETENRLSFSLTLLNDYNNGVIISHIYSKHGSNIYLKSVNKGIVEERLSEEEAKSLDQAMNNNYEYDTQIKELKKIERHIKGKKTKVRR